MHFSSYNNFGNTHDVFKLTCPSEDQQQQQQQQQEQHHHHHHHHHHGDVTADFFSFAEASSDFNHIDPTSMNGADYDSHTHAMESAYQMLPFHATSDTQANHTPMLTGHNPDHLISPMQHPTSHIDTTTAGLVDEEAMYPLMLPANHSPFLHHRHSEESTGSATAVVADEHLVISPLTSPALHAVSSSHHHHYHQNAGAAATNDPFTNNNNDNTNNTNTNTDSPTPENLLQQKLALIERQQEQLRNAHRHLQDHQQLPPSPSVQPVYSDTNTATANIQLSSSSSNTQNTPYPNIAVSSTQSLIQQQQQQYGSSSSSTVASPSIVPTTTTTTAIAPVSTANSRFIAPATPSLLMKLGQGNTRAATTTPTNFTSNSSSLTSNAAVDNMGSLPAAMIEIKPPTPTKKTMPPQPKRQRTSRTSAAFTSPGLTPMLSPHFGSTDPTIAALVSPAALRPQLMTSSPRALKPLISPSLKPNGKRLSAIEEEEAVVALASKSNYQNMREGKAKSLGIDFSSTFQSGVENRRSAHKAAEQKRRDTLKQSFDSLRKEIAEALLAEGEHGDGVGDSSSSVSNIGGGDQVATATPDEGQRGLKEKDVKQMSKVVLIQHSYEYILKLKEANRRKDQEIEQLRQKVQALKQQIDDSKKASSSSDDKSASGTQCE